ncbi:MAG: hypothetical protein ACLQLT_04125 [Methylovirgula sp.]
MNIVLQSEIARHPRVYERGQFVFDPMHYLALPEQKPGALAVKHAQTA